MWGGQKVKKCDNFGSQELLYHLSSKTYRLVLIVTAVAISSGYPNLGFLNTFLEDFKVVFR